MQEAHSFGRQASTAPTRTKRLGGYLVEAGLLTPAQVDVALNDQKMTGMRFGEILAARGWVKQQTIEYLMQKVILPEQQALQPEGNGAAAAGQSNRSKSATARSGELEATPVSNRKRSIAKPLPSITPKDDEVGWVG